MPLSTFVALCTSWFSPAASWEVPALNHYFAIKISFDILFNPETKPFPLFSI
jgi:hypothetical protein